MKEHGVSALAITKLGNRPSCRDRREADSPDP